MSKGKDESCEDEAALLLFGLSVTDHAGWAALHFIYICGDNGQ